MEILDPAHLLTIFYLASHSLGIVRLLPKAQIVLVFIQGLPLILALAVMLLAASSAQAVMTIYVHLRAISAGAILLVLSLSAQARIDQS